MTKIYLVNLINSNSKTDQCEFSKRCEYFYHKVKKKFNMDAKCVYCIDFTNEVAYVEFFQVVQNYDPDNHTNGELIPIAEINLEGLLSKLTDIANKHGFKIDEVEL